jgi:hypothetical protein
MREVPLGRTDVWHRADHEVLDLKRQTQIDRLVTDGVEPVNQPTF